MFDFFWHFFKGPVAFLRRVIQVKLLSDRVNVDTIVKLLFATPKNHLYLLNGYSNGTYMGFWSHQVSSNLITKLFYKADTDKVYKRKNCDK